MKVSLCIPMYNEAEIIADTAKTLKKYMDENFGSDYEIIFSNDGSVDGCDKIVTDLKLDNVRVVGYDENKGKGCAIRTAFLASMGEYVMFTDSDLAYGTGVIKKMISALESSPDTDLAIGSRNIDSNGYEEYTFIRKLASKTYIKIVNLVGGFKLSDSQCGCKAFRGDAAKSIFSRCTVDGFAFDLEAILISQKLGYKIKEVPVKVINHRESKVNVLRDTFGMLSDLRKMKKRINKEFK